MTSEAKLALVSGEGDTFLIPMDNAYRSLFFKSLNLNDQNFTIPIEWMNSEVLVSVIELLLHEDTEYTVLKDNPAKWDLKKIAILYKAANSLQIFCLMDACTKILKTAFLQNAKAFKQFEVEEHTNETTEEVKKLQSIFEDVEKK